MTSIAVTLNCDVIFGNSVTTNCEMHSHHRRDSTKLIGRQHIEDYWKLSVTRQLSSHRRRRGDSLASVVWNSFHMYIALTQLHVDTLHSDFKTGTLTKIMQKQVIGGRGWCHMNYRTFDFSDPCIFGMGGTENAGLENTGTKLVWS